MNTDELYLNMLNCNECGDLKSRKSPFVFEPKNQKIMLITACPSVQASLRPLTTIRFFRHICFALFGEGVCEDWLFAFQNDIYWTHLYKCYFEKAFISHDFSILPNQCMQWIYRELEFLKPEIIIVFGYEVAKRLLADKININEYDLIKDCIKLNYWNADVYVSDFPVTGLESKYDGIRDALFSRNQFGFMVKNTHGTWSSENCYQIDKKSSGMLIGLEYEYKALEVLTDKNIDMKTADDLWLIRITAPCIRRYEYVLRYESFIEDQIRSLLVNVLSFPENWRCFEILVNRGLENLDQQKVYSILRDNWRALFSNYINYLIQKQKRVIFVDNMQLKTTKNVYDLIGSKLEALCKIRNHIIHNGGYVSPSKVKALLCPFIGIYFFVNLVYVSDNGIHSILEFTKQMTKLLKDIYLTN